MSTVELVQYDIVNISNVYIILLYHLLVTFLIQLNSMYYN